MLQQSLNTIKVWEVWFDGTRYLETGVVLEDSDIDKVKTKDAILLGAIGHPDVKPGILEKGILLKLRFALDQYINLRPVILYDGVDTPLKDKTSKEIDFVVVRENTEGLYTGGGGFLKKGTLDEVVYRNLSIQEKVLNVVSGLHLIIQERETKRKDLHYVVRLMC